MTAASDEVLVVRTGTANLASVLSGLRRVGAISRVTHDPDEVRAARRVVLPGVGAFGAAMAMLREQNLVDPLVERINAGRPTLAVCVGLQVLCAASDESPGVAGLGIIDRRVTRFAGAMRVPQLGWNLVEAPRDSALLDTGYAYFANSYKLDDAPDGWEVAYADHGGPFVAALAQGPVLACQFHPELSGTWGIRHLERWMKLTETNGGAAC